MSKKVVISVIFIIVVIFVVFWLYNQGQPSSVTNLGVSNSEVINQNSSSTSGATLTTGADNSDGALNQDLNSVDGQLNGLNADNAAVNQGATAQ